MTARASSPITIVIAMEANGPVPEPVRRAAEALRTALVGRRIDARISATPGARNIHVRLEGEQRASEAAAAHGLTLPAAPEALALLPVPDGIVAWGLDPRGLAYALYELADRAALDDDALGFFGTAIAEAPTARIRSIARIFASETEDKPWFYDRSFWRDYLRMLVENRFNRFSLTLGMGYNYPYHNNYITDTYFYCPYPFLVAPEGHDVGVAELPAGEREDNLATLQFIGRECAALGLDFQLALWTQRYDFDDVPNANYTVTGLGPANLATYCRDAVTALLRAVPEIGGLTFRIHVEGGIAEGEYDFWRDVFSGVAKAGRPVEIDMHAKGLDHTIMDLARGTGMPITVSPKYIAEHIALPYHQASIREREYPPEAKRDDREQLSEGSRKFLRYGYGDLLPKQRDWKVLFRVWPGTWRLLSWGDPAFAAGYGRGAAFCDADGIEWCEPNSFKGRMGTGISGQRSAYRRQELAAARDWEKFAYAYRLLGRLAYNPEAGNAAGLRYLRSTCGDAAEACEQALGFASRILPLVTLAHAPSVSNNHYWPELYTNLPVADFGERGAYDRDMDRPVRFGNAPTLDPQLFASPREFVEALWQSKNDHRYTSLDVARWLDDLAARSEKALADLAGSASRTRAPVQRIVADARILAGTGRFFAAKLRAAVWTELYYLSDATAPLTKAEEELRLGVEAWRALSAIADETYDEDITFGPQSWLRGSWSKRLPALETEQLDVQEMRFKPPFRTVPADARTRSVLAIIAQRMATRALPGSIRASSSFNPGEAFGVAFTPPPDAGSLAPVLHFRHVNQAERWQSREMTGSGAVFEAEIPGSYTKSPWNLQFFVTCEAGGQKFISPGLASDLANEPYLIAQQS